MTACCPNEYGLGTDWRAEMCCDERSDAGRDHWQWHVSARFIVCEMGGFVAHVVPGGYGRTTRSSSVVPRPWAPSLKQERQHNYAR